MNKTEIRREQELYGDDVDKKNIHFQDEYFEYDPNYKPSKPIPKEKFDEIFAEWKKQVIDLNNKLKEQGKKGLF